MREYRPNLLSVKQPRLSKFNLRRSKIKRCQFLEMTEFGTLFSVYYPKIITPKVILFVFMFGGENMIGV